MIYCISYDPPEPLGGVCLEQPVGVFLFPWFTA